MDRIEDVTVDLVAEAKSGSTEALLKIEEGFRFFIIGLARRYASRVNTLDHGDFYDLGFMGLVEGIEEYDLSRPEKPITYLGWHMRKHMHRELRREFAHQRKLRQPHLIKNQPTPLDELMAREELTTRHDKSTELSSCLSELTDKQLEVIRLQLEGYNLREIGELTGKTVQAVQQLRTSAYAYLRAKLIKPGVLDE